MSRERVNKQCPSCLCQSSSFSHSFQIQENEPSFLQHTVTSIHHSVTVLFICERMVRVRSESTLCFSREIPRAIL